MFERFTDRARRVVVLAQEEARLRMISTFDWENTIPNWALCFRFDIVLRGTNQTPMEH